jgi:hypothetical protein
MTIIRCTRSISYFRYRLVVIYLNLYQYSKYAFNVKRCPQSVYKAIKHPLEVDVDRRKSKWGSRASIGKGGGLKGFPIER